MDYHRKYNHSGKNGAYRKYSRGYTDDDDKSMLGPTSDPRVSNEQEYDPDFDKQLNDLVDDIDKDLETEQFPDAVVKDEKDNINRDIKNEQCDNDVKFNNEFPDDVSSEEPPLWYNKQLDKKIQDAKMHLRFLSNYIGQCSSQETNYYVDRMKADHNSDLCQFDSPSHPPLGRPWTNYWKFNCITKCIFEGSDEKHVHTPYCEISLLEHVDTLVSTDTTNIYYEDFPKHIMQVVELFQQFVNSTSKDFSMYTNCPEKPTWSYLKIRSNYKKELQLNICGRCIGPLIYQLKKLFISGPGKACNVVSLYYINVRNKQKVRNCMPNLLSGLTELTDKIGPITVKYTPRTNMNFNPIQTFELGKIMTEYLAPTEDTTFIDIGCDFGVSSLLLSHKCEKVIGLNTLQHEVDIAETVKENNNIDNAMFITCKQTDVLAKCSPLTKKCISVAALNLSSVYGKSHYIYSALRNMPSVWRIVLFGTLTKEILRQLSKLTVRDDCSGEEFVPIRSSILDKSLTVPKAYDLVLLFERKSLIEPKLELIASGPTINMKRENDCMSDDEDDKYHIKKKIKGSPPAQKYS